MGSLRGRTFKPFAMMNSFLQPEFHLITDEARTQGHMAFGWEIPGLMVYGEQLVGE